MVGTKCAYRYRVSIPAFDTGRGGDQAEEREDAAVVPLNFGQCVVQQSAKRFRKSGGLMA